MARRPRLDRELERYLVDGETVIVAVRLHWFHLAREILIALAATVFAFWVDIKVSMSPGGQLLHNASLLLWWGAAGWLLWRVLNWRRDWFVATDKRFLLFYGFISRRVAMMPLLKVTDMTYDRSILGRHRRLRQVRARVGRPGPGPVDHRPRARRRHPLPRDLHPAVRARLDAALRPRPDAPAGPAAAGDDDDGAGGGGGGPTGGPDAGGPAPAGARPVARPADGSDLPSPIRTPESWYRSSNLGGPLHLGDTGEIPVVRVPHDDEDAPLYPPPHWSERR